VFKELKNGGTDSFVIKRVAEQLQYFKTFMFHMVVQRSF